MFKKFVSKKDMVTEITLNKEAQLEFESLIKDIDIDPYERPYEYLEISGKILQKVLSKEAKNALTSMNNKNGPNLLVIHNFPMDSIMPETPRDGGRSNEKGVTSEAAILGLSSVLGVEPFYKNKENNGTVISQIIPIKSEKHEAQLSRFGSKLELLPHTENIYQIPPLKYLALICLRGDPKVATSIIFLDYILSALKEKHPSRFESFVYLMKQPLFTMSSGLSNESYNSVSAILPIIEETETNETILRLNLNPGRITGTTLEAEEVVKILYELITSNNFRNKYYRRVYLRSGDLMLFNNWKVMHTRDAFQIDEKNWRWLQKCYFGNASL